jgi:hypothetical protein
MYFQDKSWTPLNIMGIVYDKSKGLRQSWETNTLSHFSLYASRLFDNLSKQVTDYKLYFFMLDKTLAMGKKSLYHTLRSKCNVFDKNSQANAMARGNSPKMSHDVVGSMNN